MAWRSEGTLTWVWSDDLLKRFVAAGTAVPEGATRWIDTPIALRIDPDQEETAIARLLDLEEESSTDPDPGRTMSPGIMPCACEAESADVVGREVAG